MSNASQLKAELLAKLTPQPDRKITDILSETPFSLSAEIVPPRNGSSLSEIIDQISNLRDAGTLFLSVTKGAGGSLRGGSLPIAQIVKENFHTPCIAHFTCRDLLPEEVENQLVDHHFLGIRNILALRGDAPQGCENWKPRVGSYPYAHQLVQQIQELNQGRYLERENTSVRNKAVGQVQSLHDYEKMDFCVGVACYPDQPNRAQHLEHFKMKVDAGAEYAISQMLFSADSYAQFVNEAASAGCGIPILPGTRLLKSKAQAERMQKRFEVVVPAQYLSKLADTDKDPLATEASVHAFLEFTEELKKAGAPGLHLFVLSETAPVCLGLKSIAR